MEKIVLAAKPKGPTFRPFTKDSLAKIKAHIAEDKERERKEAEQKELEEKDTSVVGARKRMQRQAKEASKPKVRERPNQALEAGKKFPEKLGEFPSDLYGKPIEDLDEFYNNKYTFMVVAKDGTMFRFSATNSMFILSPLNPVRRLAIFLLSHPYFSLLVMLVILVNCVFMAINKEIEILEKVFTVIYTIESCTRITARGMILSDFTYLRDPWNWLDFSVIAMAYATLFLPKELAGSVASLRTFRVLRALKTVAVVPGLKIIVGALMEAVRRLRDVIILTVFMLSIFALIGLQLYHGTLLYRCIKEPSEFIIGTAAIKAFRDDEKNWYKRNGKPVVCDKENPAGCPPHYKCISISTSHESGGNPDYGYTNFDNFASALLCAFRLMTQDYWENLYQLVLRANGKWHVMFFIVVIFLGSFYLVNLILAIVAMSYDDCQKREREIAEAEIAAALEEEARQIALLEEAMRGSPSVMSLISDQQQHQKVFSGDNGSVRSFRAGSIPEHQIGSFLDSRGRVTTVCVPPTSPFSQRRDSPNQLTPPILSAGHGVGLAGEGPSRATHGAIRRRPPPMSLQGGHGGLTIYRRGSPAFECLSLPYADEAPTGGEQQSVSPLTLSPSTPAGKASSAPGSSPTPGTLPGTPQSLAAGGVYGKHQHYGQQQQQQQQGPTAEQLYHMMMARGGKPLKRRGGPGSGSRMTSRHHMPPGSVHSHSGAGAGGRMSQLESRFAAAERLRRLSRSPSSGEGSGIGGVTSPASAPTGALTSPLSANQPVGSPPSYQSVTTSPSSLYSGGPVVPSSQSSMSLRRMLEWGSSTSGPTPPESAKPRIGPGGGPDLLPAFRWSVSDNDRKMSTGSNQLPNVVIDQSAPDDQEPPSELSDCQTPKSKLFVETPFVRSRTSSATFVDMNDIMVLKDLISRASGGSGAVTPTEDDRTIWERIRDKIYDVLFGWECTPQWYRFARYVELFVMDAFVDLFITLCIVGNTIFMAIDHADINAELAQVLTIGNNVFTAIFAAEAALKIIALGLFRYLKEKWNVFDILVVSLSLIELATAGNKAFSILRSFRLLRVFKLAKSWPTLNLLIGIIGHTLGALGNLCFVLAIIVFIFAVMGMQVFGINYNLEKFPEEVPRWNFVDFLHSFMIVFRVLCGEWIESTWDCIHCSGFHCVPFFLLTMIIGNLVVLNLFLALLLSAFGAESLASRSVSEDAADAAPNKLQEAIERLNRLAAYLQSRVHLMLNKGSGSEELTEPIIASEQKVPLPNDTSLKQLLPLSDTRSTVTLDQKECQVAVALDKSGLIKSYAISDTDKASLYSSSIDISMHNVDEQNADVDARARSRDGNVTGDGDATAAVGDDEESVSAVNVVYVHYPDDCCSKSCRWKYRCWDAFVNTRVGLKWWTFRCYSKKLVEHRYFESFIIIMIMASSISLALEDKHIEDKHGLKLILKSLDKIFSIIFVMEMVIKMSGYGIKRYFTDAWCWLDFIIVSIALVGLGAEGAGYGNMGGFRALRTFRALRPLRAVSRWEGMKVVVNALVQAIPAIFNVLLVCLVFWLVFGIMGVTLFSGRFRSCVDLQGNDVNVTDRLECEMYKHLNYSWKSSSVITFDNVPAAYLALFQVATFKGWMDIIKHAVDSKDIDQQPEKEVRSHMYLYFVTFIVFGSFFTLNLFIGVIIDNFNMQKRKAGGSIDMFMTEDQKKYYNAMKKLGSKQPAKPIPKPPFAFQQLFFKLVTNQKFDAGIMIIITLNMLAMATEHDDQSDQMSKILEYINQCFVAIFSLECALKLCAFRLYYFREPWNFFDFIVIVFSILTLLFSDYVTNYLSFVDPTLLRVVRVFRVGRVLRLVKSAKGIRTLLFSLAVSLPALFNIGLLLFLIMFIYSVFGMQFFMHVKHTNGIDDIFNFETFFQSMIILFQTATSAGWDGVLAGLLIEPPDCNDTFISDSKPNGDCGAGGLAIAYLVTYLVISFLVIINMYIAVILENFSQATEDVQQGLTQDDFDVYYEIWAKFDEQATQFLPLMRLSEFVDALEPPLQLPAPNYCKIIALDIPVYEGDVVHCLDVLDALTQNFLGTTRESTGQLGDLKKGGERTRMRLATSTMQRRREEYCARIIQAAWRARVEKNRPMRQAERLKQQQTLKAQQEKEQK